MAVQLNGQANPDLQEQLDAAQSESRRVAIHPMRDLIIRQSRGGRFCPNLHLSTSPATPSHAYKHVLRVMYRLLFLELMYAFLLHLPKPKHLVIGNSPNHLG
jgi:hypothetical protein